MATAKDGCEQSVLDSSLEIIDWSTDASIESTEMSGLDVVELYSLVEGLLQGFLDKNLPILNTILGFARLFSL